MFVALPHCVTSFHLRLANSRSSAGVFCVFLINAREQALKVPGRGRKKRTSGAKALKLTAFYGTAEAVPFVR
jgi:hypothetical protein